MTFKKSMKWVALFIGALILIVVIGLPVATMLAIALFYTCLLVVDAIAAATPIFVANEDLFLWSVLAGLFMLMGAYLEHLIPADFTKTAREWTMTVLVVCVLAVLAHVGLVADHAVSAAGFSWSLSGGFVHIVVLATYLLITEITFLPFAWRSEMFGPSHAH